MALKLYDRVRETTTTTGTGAVALTGAVTGYISFNSVLSNGDTTYYTIASSTQWEVGIGTYNSANNTLSRTTVLSSSTGSLVSFTSGSKDVFITYPAGKSVYKDSNNRTILGTNGNPTYGNPGFSLYIDNTSGTSLGFGTGSTAHSYINSNPSFTSLYTLSSTLLSLGTNNIGHFTIDSTGRAGIGLVSAGFKFTVRSSDAIGSSNGALIYNNNFDTGLTITGNTGAVTGTLLTSANGIELSSSTSTKSLIFKTVSTERMRIDSSGNVGIGNTPSGSYKLEVTGAVGGSSFIPVGITTAPTNGMYLPAAGTLGFSTNSANRVTIDSSGNVGIGTDAPSGAFGGPVLAIYSASSQARIALKNSVTGNAGGDGFQIGISGDTPPLGFLENRENGPIAFSTNLSERMRIDPNGNIYGTSGTTAMTNGFFYIPAAAGAPSGTPTAITGRVPMYYDATNNEFYVYNGAWKKVALT